VRAAVNDVEIVRYKHPHPDECRDPEKRTVPGPIGMFRHGGAAENRATSVQENPQGDKLLTVR
jgi:hypothetical protein